MRNVRNHRSMLLFRPRSILPRLFNSCQQSISGRLPRDPRPSARRWAHRARGPLNLVSASRSPWVRGDGLAHLQPAPARNRIRGRRKVLVHEVSLWGAGCGKCPGNRQSAHRLSPPDNDRLVCKCDFSDSHTVPKPKLTPQASKLPHAHQLA